MTFQNQELSYNYAIYSISISRLFMYWCMNETKKNPYEKFKVSCELMNVLGQQSFMSRDKKQL